MGVVVPGPLGEDTSLPISGVPAPGQIEDVWPQPLALVSISRQQDLSLLRRLFRPCPLPL
jgi:hypothetical protein